MIHLEKIKFLFIGVLSLGIIGAAVYINKYSTIQSKNNSIVNVNTTEKNLEPSNFLPTEEINKDEKNYIGSELVHEALLLNAKSHLEIPTYIESNNQAIHPSIVYNSDGKFGYKYILAFTPYSFLNDSTENPSIVVSEDGINFKPLLDVKSPLALPGNNCHLSDVCLFEKDDTLELWYRESNKKTRLSRLLRITTKDLKTFTEPEVIMDFGTSGYGIGAPSVIYENGIYKIYYRKNMNIGEDAYVYTESKDLKTFTPAVAMNMDKGSWTNYNPWHLEVKKIENTYYCLTMDCPDGKMDTSSLFVLTSKDGINFINPIKILDPSEAGFDNWLIYKSTFMVKDDTVFLYYSSIDKLKRSFISLLKGPDFKNLSPLE